MLPARPVQGGIMHIICQQCGARHPLETQQIGWGLALVYDRRTPTEYAIDGRWRQRCPCGARLEVVFACHDDGHRLLPRSPRFLHCLPAPEDRGYVYLAPRRGADLFCDAQDCCESSPVLHQACCPRVRLTAEEQPEPATAERPF